VPTEQHIDAAARAMEPKAFATFEAGYTCKNYFEQCAFLNAEKVVKRAKKKAALALAAYEQCLAEEAKRMWEGWTPEQIEDIRRHHASQPPSP